jgi:hypothetical protein
MDDHVDAPPATKRRIKFKMPKNMHDLHHKGEHFFHMSYLGAVGWEAHGLYQIMAIVLFTWTALGVFIHQEIEHVAG